MREMRETLQLCRGTGKFDSALNKITLSTEPKPFFGVLHAELLPYIGQNYEKTGVLLIGESHYIGAATYPQWKATNWYHAPLPAGTDSPFDRNGPYASWFDTRATLGRYMNDARGRGHTIFSRPAAVLQELGLGAGEKYYDFDHFAFVNFFQRPSLQAGAGFDDQNIEEDTQVANEVISQLISILRPNAVIFLSKRAYDAFHKGLCPRVPVYAVSHPTCPWWHRKRRDGGCAREDFKDILRKVLVEGQA